MKADKSNVEQARRKFLKTAGKLAVYTPPAMMVLAKPGLAPLAASGGGITITPVYDDAPIYKNTQTSRGWYRDHDNLRRVPGRTRRVFTRGDSPDND